MAVLNILTNPGVRWLSTVPVSSIGISGVRQYFWNHPKFSKLRHFSNILMIETLKFSIPSFPSKNRKQFKVFIRKSHYVLKMSLFTKGIFFPIRFFPTLGTIFLKKIFRSHEMRDQVLFYPRGERIQWCTLENYVVVDL